jgi:hypothetical protein
MHANIDGKLYAMIWHNAGTPESRLMHEVG